MTTNEKIYLLEIITNLALTEAKLIWTRFTAILYASTGLLAILAFAVEQKNIIIPLIVSCFGILLSLVWFQTIRLSSFYYLRWQTDADHLVENDEDLKKIVRGRLDPKLQQPSGWSASKYSMLLPLGFFVLWFVVILDSLNLIEII